MPKTVNRRIGEKVSGLHRVMATEQKQIFTFVIPETNCDSSHQLHVKLRLESMNVFVSGICLSVNVISDIRFRPYPGLSDSLSIPTSNDAKDSK